MTIGERIRQRRHSLDLSQARLAVALGIDQSTVAKWERGPNSPRHGTLQRLAECLGVSAAWLIGGEEPVRASDGLGLALGETAVIGERPRLEGLGLAEDGGRGPEGAGRLVRRTVSRGARDLPVLGVVVGGDDAVFDFNGQVNEYLERPSQLDGVHNAYALYVLGDSMEPRYLEGEIVYVNPNRPVTRGCFIAVEFGSPDGGPGKGMIKQFVKRTPTTLVLRQLNPDRTLEFAADAIKHYHRIVQSGES